MMRKPPTTRRRFAIAGSGFFRRGLGTDFGNGGRGEEGGFADAIARTVIEGLRARRFARDLTVHDFAGDKDFARRVMQALRDR